MRHNYVIRYLILMCAITLLIAACGGDADIGDPDPAGEGETTTSSPTPAEEVTPEDEVTPIELPSLAGVVYLDEELIDRARTLAIEQEGASANDLEVLVAAQVTWNDGSLGCPEPGLMYTQALVDGYWVVFSHGNQLFDYRSSLDGEFRRCIDGIAPVSTLEDR
jgi:hypothetical protein